ncbi:hypothetical protein ERJ75_000577400 [Trypanosoma vivax]|uniref:Uncharacterized protein n=1 Tax=Trypanosoma vivax (strain Y486) TaxID=1055687 RepID=F9WU04_TRYVY|nr:hypothetical protein ERJ75_000577400 [Trypanosoma vivax]CCD21050.1 hypothetical protein, conserved in T. vivax [Trypanosoma vivax Y486]|eukprot:CCD21050.1 hypothetical protein, conserved in T. vivax [Trypanosoma vivax Y486]
MLQFFCLLAVAYASLLPCSNAGIGDLASGRLRCTIPNGIEVGYEGLVAEMKTASCMLGMDVGEGLTVLKELRRSHDEEKGKSKNSRKSKSLIGQFLKAVGEDALDAIAEYVNNGILAKYQSHAAVWLARDLVKIVVGFQECKSTTSANFEVAIQKLKSASRFKRWREMFKLWKSVNNGLHKSYDEIKTLRSTLSHCRKDLSPEEVGAYTVFAAIADDMGQKLAAALTPAHEDWTLPSSGDAFEDEMVNN